MKGIKKILTMLLCLALVSGSLSACKTSDDPQNVNSGADTETTSDDTTPTEAAKELVTIDYSEAVEYTWWLYSTPNDFYSDYSQNPVVQYLNKKFNMTLTVQQPASGTELDSLNLMLGTGEYTDMIDLSYYAGSVSQLYEDGIIIDIADYLDYMPNLSKLLENEEFYKNAYNDYGQILRFPTPLTSNELMWGGMVYRRDILETMTGGNIQFPSGNEEPTTIEDWDYMLPLMKQYFEAAGMPDYAVLILPYNGVLASNDLIGSFGTSHTYYNDNGTVKYGPLQDGFYNYLKKMNEWYEAGYIYKDFASRTNDQFYLPNTALTYGGAAGVWYGLNSQLGDALSLPDYGLMVDIQPLKNPIDPANGITSASNTMYAQWYEQLSGCVTTSCENVERLLATIDFMYSEEGSMLRGCGLDKEHGSAENEIYVKAGIEDGYYAIAEDGTFSFNSKLAVAGGDLQQADSLTGNRLPGLMNVDYNKQYSSDLVKLGSEIWLAYQDESNKLPNNLSRSADEDSTFTGNTTNITDYMNAKVSKFILGTEELNETTWAEFKDQLIAYGANDNTAIMQAAYDRYLAR